MSNTRKNASSLTGAIAEELHQWLTQGKEKISTEKSLEGLEHWTSERIAFANNSALCYGTNHTISTSLSATNYSFVWKKNNTKCCHAITFFFYLMNMNLFLKK